MLAGGEFDAAEEDVGGVDGCGCAVDGGSPAGVIGVGEDEEGIGGAAGGKFDSFGLVGGNLDAIVGGVEVGGGSECGSAGSDNGSSVVAAFGAGGWSTSVLRAATSSLRLAAGMVVCANQARGEPESFS